MKSELELLKQQNELLKQQLEIQNNKKNGWGTIIIIVLLCIVIAGGILLFLKNDDDDTSSYDSIYDNTHKEKTCARWENQYNYPYCKSMPNAHGCVLTGQECVEWK